MALVGVLAGALGDATACMQSMVPAFSLNTAVGAQLDIIGLWVGQPRIIPSILIPGFFGFSDLVTGAPVGLQQPFGALQSKSIGGVWFGLNDAASGTTVLSDAQYLIVLRARITSNQAKGNFADLEKALAFIFGANAAVTDNSNLMLIFTVKSPVSPLDQALITSLDILPRPAGVSIQSINFTL